MSLHITDHTNKNIAAENVPQPVIYGVLPGQADNEIDLGELFFRLIRQWKLILGITAGGVLLAILLALMLPKIYQPTVTVSVPPVGNIAQVMTINTLLGGNAIAATPQAMFNRFFNKTRSDKTLAKYIDEKRYLKKIYPDSEQPASILFAKLVNGFSVKILEPTSQVKGGSIANPKRVKISLKVNDEPLGVSLLNGYADYVNHQLIIELQNNANKIINGRVKILSDRVATQREQYGQERLLTIKKMEHEDAKKIAQLQGQIAASLKKAELDRQTRIAKVTEALKMAKKLGIINPSTMDMLTKKGLKSKVVNTSITVVGKQSMPLYLYGSKYLTMLIQMLSSRKNDEVFLGNINTIKEKIYVIENDAVLAALKSRKSDDPWIEGLSGELAKIDAIKKITPDFANVLAYTMDNPAIVTGKSVEPKRRLIVALGVILSLFVAVFVALIVGSRNRVKQEKV